MTSKTTSELLFEKFCEQNDIYWAKIPVSNERSNKSPDYRIEYKGITVIAEVKEFDLSPEDKLLLDRLESRGSTGSFELSLDKRVRNKIDAAMPQLRRLAKGKYPAVLVLYNNSVLFPVEGLEIRLAMYGKDVVEIGLAGDTSNPLPFVSHRFGKGQKVGSQFNTTLSAVALLSQQPDQSLKLDFYHNKYAAISFAPESLRSPNVRHYQISDTQQRGGLKGWVLI